MILHLQTKWFKFTVNSLQHSKTETSHWASSKNHFYEHICFNMTRMGERGGFLAFLPFACIHYLLIICTHQACRTSYVHAVCLSSSKWFQYQIIHKTTISNAKLIFCSPDHHHHHHHDLPELLAYLSRAGLCYRMTEVIFSFSHIPLDRLLFFTPSLFLAQNSVPLTTPR